MYQFSIADLCQFTSAGDINPKYSLREWLVVPAYSQATAGDYSLIRELQEVMTQPYAEQSKEVEEKYYKPKPLEFFDVAGLSYVSCSSLFFEN